MLPLSNKSGSKAVAEVTKGDKMTEGMLKTLMKEIEKYEMRNRVAVNFLTKLATEGNGYWAKSASQGLIAMNNDGNSNPEVVIVDEEE